MNMLYMSIIVYILPSMNIGHENVGYSVDDPRSMWSSSWRSSWGFKWQGEVTIDGDNHWRNSDSTRKT